MPIADFFFFRSMKCVSKNESMICYVRKFAQCDLFIPSLNTSSITFSLGEGGNLLLFPVTNSVSFRTLQNKSLADFHFPQRYFSSLITINFLTLDF